MSLSDLTPGEAGVLVYELPASSRLYRIWNPDHVWPGEPEYLSLLVLTCQQLMWGLGILKQKPEPVMPKAALRAAREAAAPARGADAPVEMDLDELDRYLGRR